MTSKYKLHNFIQSEVSFTIAHIWFQPARVLFDNIEAVKCGHQHVLRCDP